MPPRTASRYTFSQGLSNERGLFLSDRVPFRFQNFPDNRQHVVVQGEDLFMLAARYFSPIANPDQLWWIIADFQPEPVFDPTVAIAEGRVLSIPSIAVVHEQILHEQRRLLT